MVRERVRRSEACAEDGCGSRRFYIDDDGFTYCERGHRQAQHGTVVTTDTGELLLTGKTHRRIESDGESIATTRSGFTRPQAREHYLLCLQLILRKQIAWLIETKHLPQHFEVLVADLWVLRVQQISLSVGDAETDDEQSRLYSSQTDGETTDAASAKAESTSKLPSVLDNIALLHTGMILLRLPVSTADMCLWISQGHLLYYYSAKATPFELRKRLPGSMQRLLTPESILKGERLQLLVHRTLKSFASMHGMQVPCLNHTLLLYRWLKLMALPIEIFAATRHLAASVQDDFSYHRTTRSPEIRLMAMVVVATKLFFPVDDVERMAKSPQDLSALEPEWGAWYKSFDTSSKHNDQLTFEEAFTMDEAQCMELRDTELDQYLHWCQENIATGHVNDRGRASRDVDFRRALLSMFPTDLFSPVTRQTLASNSPTNTISDVTASFSESDEAVTGRVRQAQRQMKPRAMTLQQAWPANTLGIAYRRYRTVHDLLSAHAATSKLYELAAQHSGVSMDLVIRAVFALEKALEHTEIGHKRL